MLVGFFVSTFFPTLYSLAIEGLGEQTPRASGLLTMGFLGCALLPVLQGRLANTIVRNSIILVDFTERQLRRGVPLKEAVMSAGVLRFRPMLLTAEAVVVGSSVMLMDPIFQGLALSLIFGEVAATLLSPLAVPVLYYWFVGPAREKYIQEHSGEGS